MIALRPFLAAAPPALLLGGAMPYAAGAIAVALDLVLHRGGVAVAALGITMAYAALQHFVADGGSDLSERAAFAALCVLGPVMIVALAWLEERRTVNLHALPRVALILAAISRLGRDHRAVTVSIGVAARGPRATYPEAVIKLADRALYRAKRTGRNRIHA